MKAKRYALGKTFVGKWIIKDLFTKQKTLIASDISTALQYLKEGTFLSLNIPIKNMYFFDAVEELRENHPELLI